MASDNDTNDSVSGLLADAAEIESCVGTSSSRLSVIEFELVSLADLTLAVPRQKIHVVVSLKSDTFTIFSFSQPWFMAGVCFAIGSF